MLKTRLTKKLSAEILAMIGWCLTKSFSVTHAPAW